MAVLMPCLRLGFSGSRTRLCPIQRRMLILGQTRKLSQWLQILRLSSSINPGLKQVRPLRFCKRIRTHMGHQKTRTRIMRQRQHLSTHTLRWRINRALSRHQTRPQISNIGLSWHRSQAFLSTTRATTNTQIQFILKPISHRLRPNRAHWQHLTPALRYKARTGAARLNMTDLRMMRHP